jgi:hypothetical protein
MYGVSECDREASTRRRPWYIRGCRTMGGGGGDIALNTTAHKPRIEERVNVLIISKGFFDVNRAPRNESVPSLVCRDANAKPRK